MVGRRKTYRAWDAQQNAHDPISPRDALPENDLVFFLLDLIPQLDLTPFHQYYTLTRNDVRSPPGAAGPPCLGHSRPGGARNSWKEYYQW
jgi:hypothetical protein